MINWINENKVLEVVLDQQHEQVISRSPIILKFLAQHNALTNKHIDLLCQASIGQHEHITRIVYNTLAEIAEELNKEQLQLIMKHIQQKPYDEYKDYDLYFLKSFTINAVKATYHDQHHDLCYYGLDIFWQMIQDNILLNYQKI